MRLFWRLQSIARLLASKKNSIEPYKLCGKCELCFEAGPQWGHYEGVMCKHLGEIANPITGRSIGTFCAKNWEKTQFYSTAEEYENLAGKSGTNFDSKAEVGLTPELQSRIRELSNSVASLSKLRFSASRIYCGINDSDVEKSGASDVTKMAIIDSIHSIHEKDGFIIQCIDAEISRLEGYIREIQNLCNHKYRAKPRQSFISVHTKRCIYCGKPLVEWKELKMGEHQ